MNRAKLVITLLLLPIYLSVTAQSLNIGWNIGDRFVHTYFDNKGRVKQINNSTVSDIVVDGDKMVYTVTTSVFDNAGRPISLDGQKRTNSLSHKVCVGSNSILFVDMASLFQNIPIPKDENITISELGELPEVPRYPTIGALPDREYTISVASGKMDMPIKFSYTKRAVSGQEVVKTDYGEFFCWKVTERMKVSVLFVKKNFICTTWFADGIGIVKQEIADGSGKVTSSDCLTEFKSVNK